MKKLYLVISALFTLCTFVTANAQNIKPIGPLNYASSSPNNYSYDSTSAEFALYNGVYYFAATTDNKHINTLWRTDGTESGTYMANENISNILNLQVANGKLYIMTHSNVWAYNGSSFVTLLSGEEATYNKFRSDVIQLNGLTYFSTTYAVYKTDGTPAGTHPATGYGFQDAYFTPLDNSFIVSSYGETTYIPGNWISDGTAQGTIALDLQNNRNMTILKNIAYFVHNNALYYNNPGSADVTGSQLVNNPLGVTVPATRNVISAMPVMHNTLFFAGTTASAGTELFKYNPADGAGIQLVKDILPGAASANVDFNNMAVVDSTLFFVANDAAGNKMLWKSDGTAVGTVTVKDFSGDVNNVFTNFKGIKGKLYFNYSNTTYGKELWVSDGTDTGTHIVADINPGIYGSNPAYITPTDSGLLFTANDGTHGLELFKTTDAGTVLVKDINTTIAYRMGSMQNFTKFNNLALFTVTDEIYGAEPWVTDGTQEHTHLLKDIVPGLTGSNPSNFTVAGNTAYFFIDSAGAHKYQFWKTDGTADGTVVFLANYNITAVLGVFNNKLFYEINNNGTYELWSSDGTAAGTTFVSAIPAINKFFNGNTVLFMLTADGVWQTNGTAAGTVKVWDNPGPGNFYALGNTILLNNDKTMTAHSSSGVSKITLPYIINNPKTINSKFYFEADSAYCVSSDYGCETHSRKFIISLDSTLHLNKITFIGYDEDYTDGFMPAGDKIFFVHHNLDRYSPFIKTEWFYNYIDTGVKYLAKNFNITDNTEGNGRLYFIDKGDNDYGGNSYETGVTDGSLSGSHIIDDETFPFYGMYGIVSTNNRVLFSGQPLHTDTVRYYGEDFPFQLFSFDIQPLVLPVTQLSFTAKLQNGNGQLQWSTATEQNSDYYSVQRSTDGLHFSAIGKVAAAGNSTYKQDYNYTDYKLSQYGVDKLYYRLQQYDKDGKFTYSKIVPLNINTSFTASISPIPVANQLNVNITSAKRQTVLIQVVDMAGKTIASYSKQVEAGSTAVTYSAAAWAKGLYQVHITQANGNKQTISVVR